MAKQIAWLKDTQLSNHERLQALSLVESLSKLGSPRITIRLPATGRLLHFEKQDSAWRERRLEFLANARFEMPEEGELVTMSIDTMYRSAGNHKTYGTHCWRGQLSAADFNIILTALFMDPDGFIIPHQIGMEDHQGAEGWELDFDGEDHPWHTVENIAFTEPRNGLPPIADLLEISRERIKTGYNAFAALMVLQESNL